MTYEMSVIDYTPRRRIWRQLSKKTANEHAQDRWETVTVSVTNAAKVILVLCAADTIRQKNTIREEAIDEK